MDLHTDKQNILKNLLFKQNHSHLVRGVANLIWTQSPFFNSAKYATRKS